MPATFQLLFDSEPADDGFYEALRSVEVEENADLPGAIRLTLPVTRSEAGELTFVDDERLKPYANVALVVQPESGSAECIFDGYVLAHRLHIERGLTSATLSVWGQDASWLMNLEEKVREWVDLSDADVAGTIFGEHGITPADANGADPSPTHPESGHSLMQRSTDAKLLRELARRSGKLFRVCCGEQPGQRIGWFAAPDLAADPAFTICLNDPEAWNVQALDFEWEVTRPSAVAARQALFDDPAEDGVDGGTEDAGLPLLDERGLADFAGRPMTVRLTATVDDAGELGQRAAAVLRDAGWFVRCEGEAELSRLGAVPRVGSVVEVEGVGSTHSGSYLLWSVRHTISADSHVVRFVLLRNAVGPAPQGGDGLLGGLP
ncbi:MAG: hypothetical protein FJ125_00290 [Deltaproteobacteria bacterium]|nr:hypothetical protein [Deltaproteobacteria bacterium]